MSVSSSRDPRQAVLDVLDNSAAGDWSNAGSKPGTIEAVEASELNTKLNRQGDAIYVWAPDPSSNESRGAGTAKIYETPVVQTEAWTTTGAAQANQLIRDARSIVLGYRTDNLSQTDWHAFYPENVSDHRHESQGSRRGDHYVETAQFTLDRLSDP